MLNLNEIAVNGLAFWATAAFAIFALNIANSDRAKTWAFALINLAFLWLLLNFALLWVVVFTGVLFVSLQLLPTVRLRSAILIPASALLLTLFVINKHPGSLPELVSAKSLLGAIGFSFVALRCVEVLRNVTSRQHQPPSLLTLINYLFPFHMLAAGPIADYDSFARKPFEYQKQNIANVLDGVEMIAQGLFKKFVICYAIDSIFLNDFKSTGLTFAIEALMFTLWIYLDFSAYSNIALGIGKLAGVPTPVNFRSPFMACNLIDFWDRWHISLSHFIKRNVFTPIQITLMRRSANVRPLLYASVATFISFLLVGLWHGLTLGWFLWGLIHAVGLIGVRVWTYILQRKLTPAELTKYRRSTGVRIAATVLTYIYVTAAFLPGVMIR